MEDSTQRQVQVYVGGYLAAWATVDKAVLDPRTRTSIILHTDKAHDPYGFFDDVTVHIDAERRFFQADAGT